MLEKLRRLKKFMKVTRFIKPFSWVLKAKQSFMGSRLSRGAACKLNTRNAAFMSHHPCRDRVPDGVVIFESAMLL